LENLCHNCGQAELQPLYRAPAFDAGIDSSSLQFGLARCPTCGIVNTVGADPDRVASTYHPGYYGSATRKFVSSFERVVSLASRLQARAIYRRWRRGQLSGRLPSVLDIGCGRGNLLKQFRQMGADILGLERAEFSATGASENFIRVGSVTDPEYAGREFDILVLWHVLEHIEKPGELLDHIAEHLRERGLLVIAVPNYASLQQRLFSRFWFHLDLPRHLVHFETHWLVRQLSARGFAIESISHGDPLQNIYGFIQSALNTMAPAHLNEYYHLLKAVGNRQQGFIAPILKWGLLSALLLPLAFVEYLLAIVLHRGATVKIMARKVTENDQ